ncbi:hypothetical protein FRC03_006254 [Tulasnella sp. 419]|nr:hypothetical protein FRC03_006254 [Tulasnella sp. 419]
MHSPASLFIKTLYCTIMLARLIMAKPVEKVEYALLSRRGDDCPTMGFHLKLDPDVVLEINAGLSGYIAPFHSSRPHTVVSKDDMELVGKSGDACLYNIYRGLGFNGERPPVAIGELFIDTDSSIRQQELKKLQAIYGVMKRAGLQLDNNRHIMKSRKAEWIIRKTYTSFPQTVGGRHALNKTPEENLEFYMSVSEDIAKMVARGNMRWNGQGLTPHLIDFKFSAIYPIERHYPIPAWPKDWVKWDDSEQKNYEDTKKAIQMELGIYSEKRTMDELEEELLQTMSSEPGAHSDNLGEPLQPMPSELGTYSSNLGEIEADLLLDYSEEMLDKLQAELLSVEQPNGPSAKRLRTGESSFKSGV